MIRPQVPVHVVSTALTGPWIPTTHDDIWSESEPIAPIRVSQAMGIALSVDHCRISMMAWRVGERASLHSYPHRANSGLSGEETTPPRVKGEIPHRASERP